MKTTEFIQPDNKIAAEHSSKILLRNVAFGGIEGKLLGGSPRTLLDYRTPQVCATWSKLDTMISAILPFSLVIETKDEPQGLAEAVADLSVRILLEYELIENKNVVPEEALPHVIGTLGYMHAWPYFRSDVQWLTTKLGFPPLVLPVVLSSQLGDRVAVARYPLGKNLQAPIELQSAKKPTPKRKSAKTK